jgi:hypothetical protein
MHDKHTWRSGAVLILALTAMISSGFPARALWHDDLIYSHGGGIAAQADLAISAGGELHLSINQRPALTPGSNLGYAYRASVAASWQDFDLHWNPSLNEGSYNYIALGGGGQPRIAYRLHGQGNEIRYCWLDGGVWQQESVVALSTFRGGPALVVDEDGSSLVFYGEPNQGVMAARRADSVWSFETIVPDKPSRDLMAAQRRGEEIFLAYFHTPEGDELVYKLRLVRRSGGVWTDELVDHQTGIEGLYGLDLTVDPAGIPHLVYSTNSSQNYKIVHAWMSGSIWEKENLAESDQSSYQFMDPAIVADSEGQLHVAFSVKVGSQRYELKVLQGVAGAWQEDLLLSVEGRRFRKAVIGVDPLGLRHIIYHNGPSSPWETRHLWNDEPVITTAVQEAPDPGAGSHIGSIQPNPFNPRTEIRLALAEAGPARVELLDIRGRRQRLLADEWREAGEWRLVWDGRDDAGRQLSSGLYLARLTAGAHREAEKLVMIR